MGRPGAIPDRWLDYKPIGKRIEGTRFIAFKVPLLKNVNSLVSEANLRLDSDKLLEQIPNLGIIIDLTNTNRYYSPELFTKAGVTHQKLMIPGKQTPSDHLANEFKCYVMSFLNLNKDNDKLIGVHCTHGVNRTGYLICNYMISEMRMTPEEAIQKFISARGHQIERTNYVLALHNLKTKTSRSKEKQHQSEGHNSRRDDAMIGINDERSHNNRSAKHGFNGGETSNAVRSNGDHGNHRYRSDATNAGNGFRRPESSNAFRSNVDDGNHRYRSDASSAGNGFRRPEYSNAFRSNVDDGNHRYRSDASSAGNGFRRPESSNAFRSNVDDGNHRFRSGGTSAGNGFRRPESSNAFRSNREDGSHSFRSAGNSFRRPESSNAFRSHRDDGSHSFRHGAVTSSRPTFNTNAFNNFRGGKDRNDFRGGNDGSFRNYNSNYSANYDNDNERTSRKWNRTHEPTASRQSNRSPSNLSRGRQER